MSDFDREAEREKLREKYERDKQKREASERMSELLLQGATMTNRHCPECHSPVFRYDGRQFCPTCEKEVTEGDEHGANGERTDAEAPTSDGESGAIAETTEDSAPSTAESNPEGSPETGDGQQPSADETPASASERRPARVQPPAPKREDAPEQPGTIRDGREDPDRQREAGEEFRDAEASLRREIKSLTRRAEETRDVSRKRDLLAAAREAAETLRAIRRL